MATTVLLKLAGLTNVVRYVDITHEALAQMESMMAQYPLGFRQWLQALAAALWRRAVQKTKGETDSQGWTIHLALPT
jgi:uncharacterized protein YyaL (SSP411 family)